MKQTIINNLKYLILGLLLAAGLTLVHADAWVAATTPPPANNIDAPLHSGALQIKDGGLSVGAFSAYQNAQLDQQSFFGGILRGGTPDSANSQVKIGGVDSTGNDQKVAVMVAGNASVKGNIHNDVVANANKSPLCAAKDGTIGLCGPVTTPLKEFLSVSSRHIEYQGRYDVYPFPDGNVPYLTQGGIDDDAPAGWQKNGVRGVGVTDFTAIKGVNSISNANSRLLTVAEKGTYAIKISAAGQIGVSSALPSSFNQLAVRFFIAVKKSGVVTRYNMVNESTLLINAYGTTNDDFRGIAARIDNRKVQQDGSYGSDGHGDVWKYAPYNYSFQKTFALDPGDTVDVYTAIYGSAENITHNGVYTNITWIPINYLVNTDKGQTTFDIVETDSQ